MRNYTRPNVEVTKFDVADIITSSGVIVNANTFVGANADMYEIYKVNSANPTTNVSVFTW